VMLSRLFCDPCWYVGHPIRTARFASGPTSPHGGEAGGRESISLGGPGPLRRFGYVPKEARPARRQCLLHMDVCPLQVTPALEDLGVHAMASQKPLAAPELRQAVQGEFELAVDGGAVPPLIVDPAEPHMGFGDVDSFLQSLGQAEGLLGEIGGRFDVAFLEAELAQA